MTRVVAAVMCPGRVWRLALACGHVVARSGRTRRAGLSGRRLAPHPRFVRCEVCRP